MTNEGIAKQLAAAIVDETRRQSREAAIGTVLRAIAILTTGRHDTPPDYLALLALESATREDVESGFVSDEVKACLRSLDNARA